MGQFNNKIQDEFKADFGFLAPHRTPTECKSPVFADKRLHRIAIMKDQHFGSKGDMDENGLRGWTSKFICTGCGKRFTINKQKLFFHVDKK